MQSENVNITLQDLPNFMRYITTFDSIFTILWLKKTRKNRLLQYYTLPFTLSRDMDLTGLWPTLVPIELQMIGEIVYS